MTSKKFLPFLFCLLLLGSCGKSSSGFDAKVALDPAWYSVDLPGRENNLTAFTEELIEAIGKEENLNIGVYQRSWSNLMVGLQSGEYQAICSPMQPYLFYEKLYQFSDIYLTTGPVIVTSISSSWNSLEALSHREVAILRGSSNALLLEKYPEILQRTYDSVQQALDDVQSGVLDAMILDILTAEAFVNDLYAGKLKIASAPLSSEGIRLVALQGTSQEFIRKFNRGLSRLKSQGLYSQLARKWGLGSEPKR